MNPNISIGRTESKAAKTALMLCTCMLLGLVFATAVLAETKSVPTDVVIGKSVILNVQSDIKTVSITDPEVADIVVVSPKEVQINGKNIGSTNMIIWDKAGARTFFDINVVVDFGALKDRIADVAPGDDIKLQMISKDTMLVTGTVSSDERKLKVHNLLLGFGRDITETELYVLQGGVTKEVRTSTGGEGKGFKFVMLLEVSNTPQVMLQITVASVDRTALRDLGVNWSETFKGGALFSSVGSGLPINTITNLIAQGGNLTGSQQFQNTPNFGVIDSHSGTAYMIKALSQKGLAKVLAEPNMIVKSGDTGEFLAGGEIPIPIVNSLSTGSVASVTVEYKKFGVRMNFGPTVTESGLIKLKLDPAEVSSLDSANSVSFSGFVIPALKVDSVKTSVDLHEGESFVIAGLIRDDWSKTMEKFPLLGDLPILGAFFRQQHLDKKELELVFFVTPKIVKPMAPGVKTELPGANEPNDAQKKDLDWMPLLPTHKSLNPEDIK